MLVKGDAGILNQLLVICLYQNLVSLLLDVIFLKVNSMNSRNERSNPGESDV